MNKKTAGNVSIEFTLQNLQEVINGLQRISTLIDGIVTGRGTGSGADTSAPSVSGASTGSRPDFGSRPPDIGTPSGNSSPVGGATTYVLSNVQSVSITAQNVTLSGGAYGVGGGGSTVNPNAPSQPNNPGSGSQQATQNSGGNSDSDGFNLVGLLRHVPSGGVSGIASSLGAAGPFVGAAALGGFAVNMAIQAQGQSLRNEAFNIQMSERSSQGNMGYRGYYESRAFDINQDDRMMQTLFGWVPLYGGIVNNNIQGNENRIAKMRAKDTARIASLGLPGGEVKADNYSTEKRFISGFTPGSFFDEITGGTVKEKRQRELFDSNIVEARRLAGPMGGQALLPGHFESPQAQAEFFSRMSDTVSGEVEKQKISWSGGYNYMGSSMMDKFLKGNLSYKDLTETIAGAPSLVLNDPQGAVAQLNMARNTRPMVYDPKKSFFENAFSPTRSDIKSDREVALEGTLRLANDRTKAFAESAYQTAIADTGLQLGLNLEEVRGARNEDIVAKRRALDITRQLAQREPEGAGRRYLMTEAKRMEGEIVSAETRAIDESYSTYSAQYLSESKAKADKQMAQGRMFGTGSDLSAGINEFVKNQRAQIELDKAQLEELKKVNLDPAEIARRSAAIINKETQLMQAEEMGRREAAGKDISAMTARYGGDTAELGVEAFKRGSFSTGAQTNFAEMSDSLKRRAAFQRTELARLESKGVGPGNEQWESKNAEIKQTEAQLFQTEMEMTTYSPGMDMRLQESDLMLKKSMLMRTFTSRGSIRETTKGQMNIAFQKMGDIDAMIQSGKDATGKPLSPEQIKNLRMQKNQFAMEATQYQGQLEGDFIERLTNEVQNSGGNYKWAASQFTKREAGLWLDKTGKGTDEFDAGRFFGGGQESTERRLTRGERLLGRFTNTNLPTVFADRALESAGGGGGGEVKLTGAIELHIRQTDGAGNQATKIREIVNVGGQSLQASFIVPDRGQMN